MAYPATPKTWVAADVLAAAQLNAELRDALLAAFPLGVDGWTAYTPTLVQSGAVTKTSTYAKYMRVGRTIFVTIYLDVTGSGTGSNAVVVGLPVAAASPSVLALPGQGYVYNASSTDFHPGHPVLTTTTTIALLSSASSAGVGAQYLGLTSFTSALAAGDIISMSAVYEAAS